MNTSNAKPIESEGVDLEERNWLPRHVGGDTEAFEQLMTAYRGFVLTLLWRYGVDHESRDDLFQEIFIKIHQAAASYRPSQALRPWLVTITLNTLRNHRRKQFRQSRFLSRLFNMARHDIPSRQNPGADQMVEQKTTVLWLEGRIKNLPERQREVLVLSTMKGLSMKDIARVMALPVNTIKTHLRRARLALAKDLDRRESVEN